MSTAEIIAKALGGRKAGGGWMARCPAHDDREPSLSLRLVDDGKLLIRCHAGCDQARVIGVLRSRGLWTDSGPHRFADAAAKTQPDRDDARRTDSALAVWCATLPAVETPVAAYLVSRGLTIAPPATLRFHPRLKHLAGSRWPAMVALVSAGADDKPLGIHRTFLAHDGSGKAPVDPQKMMLGPCRGGAVRLADPGELLMVGEGIETCLAAMQATGHPAWAALSTSGLRTLDLPANMRDVIVLADGDDPGEAAARECAWRWKREGRRVRIARPRQGSDFNVDSTGWRVIDRPPVRFRRAAGMKPLAVPIPGGSIDTLRSFFNVQSDSDFVLVVAWALAVLRSCGPYPVIVLSGVQGSAKSTFSAILRALLDPNTAPLRALPRVDRDLFIAASNGHVLAFDNVSSLPAWISDTLCRLATGGGFSVRQLYTDQDEVLFDASRPVILNGIEDIVTRPDLADRAMLLTLEPIPEDCRRPETELWAAFEAERPRILGALLDAVAEGLRRLPETHLPKLPRMADFALWVTACETALWPAGIFWAAYGGNRDEAVESVIDADPIAAAVRTVMATRTVWTGTASDLLGALDAAAGERVARSKTWPDSLRALAGRLRRAATFLRQVGIAIGFDREGRARTRTIHITATQSHSAAEDAGVRPSAPSASSAPVPKPNSANGIAAPNLRTVTDDADGASDATARTVRANPLKSSVGTNADGADANRPPQSEPARTGWRVRL